MELFIILLIFGYFKFIKGFVNQQSKKKTDKQSRKAKQDHPYQPYRQTTFDELRERYDAPAPHPAEGEDPCHDQMYAAPPRVKPVEGVDPCHDGLFQRPERILPEETSQPGWRPDLSADALMQAVVMQEILTRPCQRQRRGLH